jgi:hypothetical protein
MTEPEWSVKLECLEKSSYGYGWFRSPIQFLENWLSEQHQEKLVG